MTLPSLQESLDEIDAWMTEAAPEIRAAHGTASEEELERLATFGDATADLITLYRRFGGTTDWQPFWEGNELVPPQSAIALREMMNGHESGGIFYRWMPGEWWNPRWLPFLDNHSSDMYCIDLDTGEVVLWSKDSAARPALAPSLAAWLGLIVLGSREGLVEWDADAGAQAVTPTLGQLNRLHERVLPGYPTARVARMRREVEGQEPPPRPPALVEGCTVTRQWWAPASASVHALAFLPARGLLAVGQYDWGEAPGGLSLVDPETGEVVEVVLGKDEGSALELETAGDSLVIRRLRSFNNEVLVYDGSAPRMLRGELPTRMARFVGLGEAFVAIGSDPIEIRPLQGDPGRELAIAGENLVVGLSPDGRTLAVGQRDQPLRWFDTESGALLGHTEEPVLANQIVFGLDGDLWVAGNRQSRWFDLRTGAEKTHEIASDPFVVALHRSAGRVAFAGYGGTVSVLDARSGERLGCDSTHGCRVYGLAWDAEGRRLWSGDEGGQLVERLVG